MEKNARLITVLHLCSFLLWLYSPTMLVPLFVGLFYHEQELTAYFSAFVLAFALGLVGWHITRHGTHVLKSRDGFLVAVLFWLLFSAVSAIPFYLDHRLDLTLVDALFEGVSGITTTGASVLNNIDGLPRSTLYYRAQLNFLGGLGIIVLAVAVLPFLGIGGSRLYQSEMPGPMKEEKLTPRLVDTARNLWIIYTVLAGGCAVCYYCAGMGVFDALCHSLSTVSLGGFSTHDSSLGFYQSPAIELVAGVYSILAAVNFSLYFWAVARRSPFPILNNAEFRFFLLVLSCVAGVTCIELYRADLFGWQDAAVHGFFQTVSIMTDNGLGAGDYPVWPAHVVLLLLGASFFGGCVGSTCGGIKAMRFLLLYRQGSREVSQLIHPDAVLTTKVDGRPVSDRLIRSVWGLFFLYIFFTCVFVWGLVALGYDFVTAFATVAACINNMGVGYGDTAAGFGILSEPAKLLMCLAMLFGRLEIFPILVVLSPTFWRF